MTRTDLQSLYRTLAEDWPRWTPRHRYADDYGTYAFTADHDRRGTHLIAAKRSTRPDGAVSFFTKKIVARARDHSWPLVLFLDQSDADADGVTITPDMAWVFDPATVTRDGEPTSITSPKGSTEPVLDIHTDRAVLLGDYMAGRADPPEPEPTDPTRPRTLARYVGVEAE